MKIIDTKLPGVYIIEPDVFQDERGEFVKVFHKDTFTKNNLAAVFEEQFYTVSKKGVLRGMRFQTPPKDHCKLVYVAGGSTLDVVLDIRAGSPTYGEYISVELSAKNRTMIYIPAGCAHGYVSLEDGTRTVYAQTTMYAPEHDAGIRPDSFGMEWPIKDPIVSERDQTFPTLGSFKTPFTYEVPASDENRS